MTTPAAATDAPDGTRSYSAPHPETGEIFNNLPNITSIIPTPVHIFRWEQKMVLLGMALREDLQVQVAAAHLLPAGKPRNTELARLAEQAKIAGQLVEKGQLLNDRGSGYHALAERLDDLVPPGAVSKVDELGLPRSMAAIARSYVDAMAGVIVIHSEVTGVSFTHGYAGTGDRLVRFAPTDATAAVFDRWNLGEGCYWIDAKFGTVHEAVAMQLAALAGVDTYWDAVAGTHTAPPDDLHRDLAFAFHPDQGLIPVDLTGAGDAFLGALAVRKYEASGVKPLCPPLKISAGGVSRSASPDGATPAPPADPFAGLPDGAGALAPDPAAKTAHLIGRIVALGEVGLPLVAQRWPVVDDTPVPTFQALRETGALHTVEQLALIEAAVAGAERELAAPFPPVDTSEPANVWVANADERVTALAARLAALPPDLLAAIAARHRIPDLDIGRVTLADLIALEPLVQAAEADWAPRAEYLFHLFEVAREKGVSRAALLAVLKVSAAAMVTGPLVNQLDQIIDAIGLDLLADLDGRLVVTQPDVLLEAFDGPAGVLKAARRLAKANGWRSPRSTDVVLGDPLLAAALIAV